MKPYLLALCMLSTPALAAPRTVAIFDFNMVNTSPAATTADETARLQSLDRQLHAALAAPGRYEPVDVGPVREELANVRSIRGCNGCELDLARKAGAELAAYGWVQKVSNLILNINVVIEDAKTGQVLKAESVDIRGNTDESWRRGLRYLINERMFRSEN